MIKKGFSTITNIERHDKNFFKEQTVGIIFFFLKLSLNENGLLLTILK